MTTLLLHIGPPKTGTTAIQTTFSNNAATLARNSVCYPVISGRSAHKHSFAVPYLTGRQSRAIRRHTQLKADALSTFSADYWRQIVDQCTAQDFAHVILSAESFWSGARPEQPMRDRLSEICDQVTVVGYARSPQSRFLAKANQNIRMLRPVTPPSATMYRSGLTFYRDNGFENLSIHLFGPEHLKNGDVVDDFCDRHLPGLSSQLDRGSARANESISNEAMVLFEQYQPQLAAGWRAGWPARGKSLALLRKLDRQIGGEARPSLKPEVAAAIVGISKDLHWLRDETGLEFPEVDYRLAGTIDAHAVQNFTSIRQYCPVDPARLAELDARWAAARRKARPVIGALFALAPMRRLAQPRG